MGLTLTWETNLATLRHLFYSSATDWRLCEEGYHVVEVEYFGMGRDGLAGIRMQQVQRSWRRAGHASRRVEYGQCRAGHPSQDAKVVVTSFLEAFRKGDNDAATKLLTKVARQKIEETGRCVTPPANDSAKIEVEDAAYPTPEHDIAHVPTKWIDLDETGNRARTRPPGFAAWSRRAGEWPGLPPMYSREKIRCF